jgi:DNA-directed RNA polymerase subunit RPC12/RpoP
MEVNPMDSAATIEKTKYSRSGGEKNSPVERKTPRGVYVQNCPVCGRPLEIAVEHLGRRLNCRHCGGRFVAYDPLSPFFAARNSSNLMMHRAEELLELCERRLHAKARIEG